MKKLVLEVLTTPWCKLLRVKEQEDREWRFTYKEFDLVSAMHPDIDFNPGFSRVWGLYVRGTDRPRDAKILVVPSDEWLAKCQAAVRAYNTSNPHAPPPHEGVEEIE